MTFQAKTSLVHTSNSAWCSPHTCIGSNEPYPQLRHKIKMAAIGGGLCTEILWRGYRFAMNDIKKSKNISGEAYIQSSNANARVLLNLSIFWLVFIIPGELVLDDCI